MKTTLTLALLVPLAAACQSTEDRATTHDAVGPELIQRGAELYEAGDYTAALGHYERALALDPGNAHAHDLRGEALLELGRYEESMAACTRAAQLDPENAYAHSHRGQALYELERYAEALASFERALALEPGNEHFQRCRKRAQERVE